MRLASSCVVSRASVPSLGFVYFRDSPVVYIRFVSLLGRFLSKGRQSSGGRGSGKGVALSLCHIFVGGVIYFVEAMGGCRARSGREEEEEDDDDKWSQCM